MMYNIYTGRGVPQKSNDEIIILVSRLNHIQDGGHQFLFTDRHAYPITAQYYNNLDDLDKIDWALLQARNFKRNPDDPLQIERYQAEALIYQNLPVDMLIGVICYTDNVKSNLEKELHARNMDLSVHKIRGWYF